ncbi:hypothetical protein AAT19DRAFT_9501 [Rhodotorula toruloides]|uniref:Uncharacterized protein n=1 Tax=Rhodotorula toruloides TaxID=5286 RepID=A0A2T0A2D3_RHOTO|nr:hypothetical protein AAT19DRAFT_9501 [Rhodotorula toruloides]
MADVHPVITSSYRLPEWLSYLLPGESFSRDIAGTAYYRAWKGGVLAVFAGDEYWGSLIDASGVVKEQLAAIRQQVVMDSERVHAAAAHYAYVDAYFMHLARNVIGNTRYLDIIGINGNPLEGSTAHALGQAYGRILLAQTPKGDLMFKLAEMMSYFRNAKPALNEQVKDWRTETGNDVWRVLETDPAHFTANVARVLSRCNHALRHLEDYKTKKWMLDGRERRLSLDELFHYLVSPAKFLRCYPAALLTEGDAQPTAATLLQTTPLVDSAVQGCEVCAGEHRPHAAQQVPLARSLRFFPLLPSSPR